MRKLKVDRVALCGIALCGLLLAASATPTDAQMPGPHPAYLHAIRNLREARGLLQTNFGVPVHAQAAAAALPQINAAINDLKGASHLDEKSLGAVPPPNNDLPPGGRFHKVADLLGAAQHDAGGAESDPVALPYRDRALKHIEAARAAIAPIL